MASNNSMEIGPRPSQKETNCCHPPPPEDAESRTSSWWYRAKKLERRIKRLRKLVNYLHGVPQQAASSVEPVQPAVDAIPAEGTSFIRATPPCSFLMADSLLPSSPTAPTAVGKCADPDLSSLSEDSVQSPFCQESAATEVSQKSGRLVRKVGTNVRAYLAGFRRAHRKKTTSANLKAQFVSDHDASSVDSSFSEEINVYFDHSGNNASCSCA
ncbi:unnamed protein product [Cuscuta campestris]|uniref:Uncharacterized protein n=1 Tax=Cuscuta campestris TaxID=132261 RepID=A0A484LQV3_9ASTE|nr:unnamed protein product [Cuscuta campestris]